MCSGGGGGGGVSRIILLLHMSPIRQTDKNKQRPIDKGTNKKKRKLNWSAVPCVFFIQAAFRVLIRSPISTKMKRKKCLNYNLN
jgi:hypothetical protein